MKNLVRLLVLFIICKSVITGKEKTNAKGKDNNEGDENNTNNTREESIYSKDASELSLHELTCLTESTLQEICKHCKINRRGNVDVLAIRIYYHFHPHPALEGATTEDRRPQNHTNSTEGASSRNNNNENSAREAIKEQVRNILQEMGVIRQSNQNQLVTSPRRDTSIDNERNSTGSFLFPNHVNNPTRRLSSPGLQGSNHETQNTGTLPSLPENILKKIRNGEFVNLDTVLPDVGNQADENPGELSLVFGEQGHRSRIHDPLSWTQAWSVYMRAYCYYHPHRSLEIVSYFNHAARFLNLYRFSEFCSYDRQFRLRLASNSALRWDSIDIELQSMFLKSPSLAYSKSRGFDHSAGHSHSPTTGHSRGLASHRTANPYSYTSSDTSSLSRFRNAPQPTNPSSINITTPTGRCFSFNNNGFCDKPTCTYSHTCQFCKGNHPQFLCKQSQQKSNS